MTIIRMLGGSDTVWCKIKARAMELRQLAVVFSQSITLGEQVSALDNSDKAKLIEVIQFDQAADAIDVANSFQRRSYDPDCDQEILALANACQAVLDNASWHGASPLYFSAAARAIREIQEAVDQRLKDHRRQEQIANQRQG